MMMKRLLILLMLFLSIVDLHGQSSNTNEIDGLTIDPGIKIEAEQYFGKSEFDEAQDKWLIYNNRMLVDFYEDDKLIQTTKDKEISKLAKSVYYWRKDTLNIDGAFGLFGGFGFNVKIINGKATLYHMLASDEFPSYSYNENDSLIFRLEVPCAETKIILSDLPDPEKKQVIYGYVEFKSGEYYSTNGSVNGKEIKPRNRSRINMRMYFKSGISPF
jgi:hypothetical protein